MWIFDSPSDDPITILVDGEHESGEKTTCNKKETLGNKWKVCLKHKRHNPSHSIHVQYIYLHLPYKSTIHVGKYTVRPMDSYVLWLFGAPSGNAEQC